MGQKKKRLRQGRFEHNTTQFSRGRRVLRSGGPNHINYRVHCVHLELTTKRLKAFPTKESQRAAPVAAPVKVSQNHFDIWCARKGGLGVSLEARVLLLQVVIPVMTLWLHSLRLEVAVVQQQVHLLRAPMRVHSHRQVHAPAAAQLRWNEQALPVEHLDKFYPSSDMSGSVTVYVTQGFHTVNRACLSCSLVSIVSKNRFGAAKSR
jgi:hypothetical protein